MRKQRAHKRLQEVREMRAQAMQGGGTEAIRKQHEKGKLTARERLEILFDPDSFQEVGLFVKSGPQFFGEPRSYYTDGVVTGYGTIDGRLVYAFAQDFTIMGGSLGIRHAQKIVQVLKLAVRHGVPVIALNDSGGARIQEGMVSLAGYAEIFYWNSLASGVIPQIAAIMGPCAGGAVYSPALMDFIFMVRGSSYMFLTGPQVVKTVLHEDITPEELGGARVHAQKSGVAHFVGADDEDVLHQIRRLLSYLPSNNLQEPPVVDTGDSPDRREEALTEVVPEDPDKGYDVREVIRYIVDNGEFLEVWEHWAQNAVTAFARIGGYVVGIVANQPRALAGVLDIAASRKIARFVRFCDAFNIPIVTLEDVPGFLPGVDQEHGGIIAEGAKIVYAYSESTVPKITVILRKAYGGAYCVMGPKHVGADFVFAWPSAEIAVMGAEGAVNILYRKQLAREENPEELRQRLVEEYREKVMNPYVAAEYGFVDDIIDPRDTRVKIYNALLIARSRREQRPRKKHPTHPL